jgi:hypothetical protein
MKNETNKTVVEQLVEKIEHYSNYTIRIPIDAVEQFKEMEKEQLKNVWLDGRNSRINGQDPLDQIKNL